MTDDWYDEWLHGSPKPINHYDGIDTELTDDEEEMCYRYLKHQKSRKAQDTYRRKKTSLKQWVEYLTTQIGDAQQRDYMLWIDDLLEDDYAPRTVRVKSYDISDFYQFLDNYDYIDECPIDSEQADIADLRQTRRDANSEQERDYLTQDDSSDLLEACESTQERVTVELLLKTGVRRTEATEIKLNDVSLDEQKISVTSGKSKRYDYEKRRTVYFNLQFEYTLKKWIEGGDRASHLVSGDCDYLLVTQEGNQMHPDTVTDIVQRVAERAGLQRVVYTAQDDSERMWVHPHLLRRTYGAHRIKNGMPLPVLQRLMGHESVETTRERYIDLREQDVAEAEQRYSPSY